MLDKKMDEYVTRVEDDAYELGISVGKHQERERIVVLLNDFRERLYDDANVSDDPAWDIERAEAVERCVTLIKGEN